MKLERYLIIALALVIIYLFQCRKPIVQEVEKEVIVRDTIQKSDTIVKYLTKSHENLTPIEIIHDTVMRNDSNMMDLSDTNVFWSTYLYEVKDSLLDAKITARSQTRPQIDFDYTLKNFTIHDSVIVTETITKIPPKRNAFFIGAEMSGSQNRFGFSPSLTFYQKKGFNYSLRYDLINKEIGFKFEKKISFRK